MIKVWTGECLNYSYIPLLYPNWGIQTKDSHLFFSKKVFARFNEPFVDVTNDPSLADFLLVPHNFPTIRNEKYYLENFVRLSNQYNKKIIVFVYGDSNEKIKLPNVIVFRTSSFKKEKMANEIMMPAFVEDLAENFTFKPREKINDKPVIGFCGWVSSFGIGHRVKAFIKKILWLARGRGAASIDGIALRRKAIKILKRSKFVKTNFIERKTYSGHASTISVPQEKARQEYIENMSNSDFALVARGNGNFSFRFYEVLSAGRIPLFINTDCILPLDDYIKYNDFVLLVDYKDIKNAAGIVADFYKNIGRDDFLGMQRKAREAFENFLRADKFLEFMFLKEGVKKLV